MVHGSEKLSPVMGLSGGEIHLGVSENSGYLIGGPYNKESEYCWGLYQGPLILGNYHFSSEGSGDLSKVSEVLNVKS